MAFQGSTEAIERDILLRRLRVCRIGGAERMSLAVLRNAVRSCYRHGKARHIEQARTDATLHFFTRGDAVRALADRKSFLDSKNVVRMFPVPHEFGFLLCASAEEYCGHSLTPEALYRLLHDETALEVYSRGVTWFLDMFGIPSVSENPEQAIQALIDSFATTNAHKSKYSICALFYRVLASTFFLDHLAFEAIAAVFSKETVAKIQKRYPKETCGLNRVVHYTRFRNELDMLREIYAYEPDVSDDEAEASDASSVGEGTPPVSDDELEDEGDVPGSDSNHDDSGDEMGMESGEETDDYEFPAVQTPPRVH